MTLPIPSGVAIVSIRKVHSSDFGAHHPHLVPADKFQAIVQREKLIDGRLIPQLEFIVEDFDEKRIRRALRLRGYPSTKTLVPVKL